jgi:hypothetical protein
MGRPDGSSKRWPLLRWGLGALLSVGALGLALRNVKWSALGDAFVGARWSVIALALCVVILNTVVKAWRWRTLFFPARPAFWRLWMIFLVGQLLNAILPARTGDLARAWLVGTAAPVNRARGLATIALEKAADMLMLGGGYLAALAWLTLADYALPSWLVAITGPLFGLILVFVMMVLLILTGKTWGRALLRWMTRPLPGAWQASIQDFVVKLNQSMRVVRDANVRIRMGLASVVIWLLGTLTNYIMFRAFRLTVPPVGALVLMVALMSGIVIPTLPGNLGVFPYLSMLVLSLFGVERAKGVAFGLALHGVVYLPLLVLGGLALLRHGGLAVTSVVRQDEVTDVRDAR